MLTRDGVNRIVLNNYSDLPFARPGEPRLGLVEGQDAREFSRPATLRVAFFRAR